MPASPSVRRLPLTVAALVFATGAALAGTARDTSEAQSRYRQDMADCASGITGQPINTCRTEARNALAEAKRGGLQDAPSQYTRNALRRCTEFQGDELRSCEARVLGPSRVQGSVEGGGVLREGVILVPVK